MNTLIAALATLAIVTSSGPLFADSTPTSTKIDVTTSNVQEDLSVFYHNQYPVNTLAYLVPHKAQGDQYDDFKFLTMYAYKGDLYLYFYTSICKCEFTDVRLEWSDSTTMASDKSSIVEQWHEVDDAFKFTVHDHNGTDRQFYKCVAKGFYTYSEGTQHRVKTSRLLMGFNTQSFPCYARSSEGAEYSWQDPKDGEDQVYTYYKNNYIVIDGAKGLVQLIPTKYSTVQQTEAGLATELQWLFFSYSNSSKGANYDLGRLTSVQVSYEYLTFDADYRVDRAYWTFDHYRTIYSDLYGDPTTFFKTLGHNAREASFRKVSADRMTSTVTPNEKHIDETTSQKTWFFFWNETHEIHYSYNTLQALDDDSVAKITDADFKGFISRYRSGFKYAINFKEDTRNVIACQDSFYNFNDWYNHTCLVTTRCHEAHAIQITRLSFENEDGKADFNALMNPVDVDEVVTTTPKDYKTVAIVNNKVVKWIRGWTIAFIVVACVVGGIYITIVLWRFKKTSRLEFGFSRVPSRSGSSTPNKTSYSSSSDSHKSKSHYSKWKSRK
jgi:hypothetical protein